MSVFDEYAQGIVDAFFQTGDNWRERIGDATISFTSPETSTQFSAKWIDSRKSGDKRLGLFDYPNIQGTVAQDLKASSNRFSISFRFDDYANNDLQARDFYAVAARECGQWTVIHPVYGQLGLQLVSIEENKRASEGGSTTISSEWLETIDADKLQTMRELAGLVDGQCSVVQLDSIEQFVADCDATGRKWRSTIESTVAGIQRAVDYALSPLFASEDLVSSAMLSTALLIQGSLDAVLLPLNELAGQLQDLVNIPLLARQDTTARFRQYGLLQEALSSLAPGGFASITPTWATAQEQINAAATTELARSSALVALSQIVLTATTIQTRGQALDLAQQIADSYLATIEELDAQQTALEDQPIATRYIAARTTYNDLIKLLGLTLLYLQGLVSELKIERRITLDRPRAVAELCISEFHSLDQYDEIVAANKLKGAEILMLPAGKEIVLYV